MRRPKLYLLCSAVLVLGLVCNGQTDNTVPERVSGISTTVSLEGGVSVTLAFESPDVSPDYPVLTYNVTARNTAGIVIPLGVFPANGTMETFTTNSSIGLEENTVYTATVVAENIVGSSTSSEVTFYTSDVQEAWAGPYDSRFDIITCTFAMGTQSRGCQVQIYLTASSLNPYEILNIERSTVNPLVAELIDLARHYYYVAVAFDWEFDGTISSFGIPFPGAFPPTIGIAVEPSLALTVLPPTSTLIITKVPQGSFSPAFPSTRALPSPLPTPVGASPSPQLDLDIHFTNDTPALFGIGTIITIWAILLVATFSLTIQ